MVDDEPDGRSGPRSNRSSEDPGSASSSDGLSTPSVSDASGYGLTMTLVGAVLLALAYYGYVALATGHELGEALPQPFYFLGFALLFVVELLNSRRLGLVGIARAIAFTAVYGALLVFAVEGGAYLWEQPSVALENFEGVTVLAIALVVAALVYVGYLAVVEADRRS